MLMMDVRNAIARILDRYVLADIVDITLRKMRRDNVPIPFMVEKFLHPAPAHPAAGDSEEHPDGSFLSELMKVRVREDVQRAQVKAPRGRKSAR
jgi:hypothetical protein